MKVLDLAAKLYLIEHVGGFLLLILIAIVVVIVFLKHPEWFK